jgi:hypothetical protein
MAPFEVLYGRRCRTPLNWIEPGEKVIFGLDLVEEAESIVHRIQENLKAAKSHQETYANKRCRPLEFEVGNHEEVWGERKISTSLHGIVPHPREVWNCGLQA